MTIQRMDHVGIVVDDLAAATEFFVELGLELQGEASVEGRWVDRVVGLEGVRADIAMLQTPHGNDDSYAPAVSYRSGAERSALTSS
ncbi:MAG TPA: VOC family protein [Gaiellaceae bacterium]|jgi:catechol 2,3-dioxygenase-like lactoylglutathione lyase family enzyme|nr:VOC family protein [Gaiellaceae bacterium]